MTDRWMTLEEVEEHFNVSPRTVRRWVTDGLPVHVFPALTLSTTRMVRFSEAATFFRATRKRRIMSRFTPNPEPQHAMTSCSRCGYTTTYEEAWEIGDCPNCGYTLRDGDPDFSTHSFD